MADLIKIRRDTKANWDAVSESIILQEGEIGIITDVAPKQCKIGNGHDVWGALPYQSWVDPDKLEGYDRKDLGYVVCSTEGGQAAKVVNDPATLINYELSKNVRLLVKMNQANTASGSITLAINGTDAKPLQYNGAAASDTNTWANNEVLDVYYDGTNYIASTHGGAQFATGQKVGDVEVVNIPGNNSNSVISQKGATDLVSEYNVSTNNNNAEYAFAQAVALVPESLQKGGLTIKYIDSTTEKYVVKRLMSSTWSTVESEWQGIDDEPAAGSDNLVKSGGVHQSIKPFPINLVDAEQFWLKDTGISNSTNFSLIPGWLTLLIPCYPNQIFQWVKNEGEAAYALCDSNKHQLPLFEGSTYRTLPLGKNTITIPDNPDIKYIAFDLGRSQNTPIPNQTIYLNSDAAIFEGIKKNISTSYNIDTFVKKSINVFPQLKIYNRHILVGGIIVNGSTSKLVYVPVEYGETIIWRVNNAQFAWYAFCTDDLLHWIGTSGTARVGDNEITVTEQSAKYIALQISFKSSPDTGTYIIYKSWKDSINEVVQFPEKEIPLNPWKGKKMLVCGASNISVGSWAVQAGEMLGMTVINAGSSPRNYNTEKGTVHRWHNDSVGYCYSLTNSPTAQTVFHQTKGSKSNPFTFVSFDSSAQKLTLTYQEQNYVFDYIDYTENDVWLCGLSSTIAECQAGGVSTSMSWESKFTSDLNLVVFGEQAGETQVTSNDIIDSILLPTSDNLHYRYSDNVPLEDRRNTTIGAIIYLLDKLWSSAENGGKDAKLCRVVFTLDALYDTDYSSLNGEREAIKRMGDLLNLPYLEHYKKLYLSLYNRTDNYDGDGWCYDGIHPSGKGAERLKYMFANELLQLY